MSHHLVVQANVSPVTSPQRPSATTPNVLDAHRHRLFAQRLAILIARLRATTAPAAAKENADEH